MTFHSGGQFPSRVFVDVVSGAVEGGAASYFGSNVCIPCGGDCDGDRRVTISELVRGVAIALGGGDSGVCSALDEDHDAAVSIAELVAAVGNALNGCPSGQGG
jgi:hypothetical protein